MAIAIALICLAEPRYLPEKSVAGAMMVLAQGHFFLSYLYQYRAGKMTPKFTKRYLFAVAGVLSAYALVSQVKVIEAITAGYFIIHFFYDERHLLDEKPNSRGWLICLPTIVLLAAEVLHLYAKISSPTIFLALIMAGSLIIITIIWAEWRRRSGWRTRNFYFFLVFLCAVSMILVGRLLPGLENRNALNFIILLHFANWYLHQLRKLDGNRVGLKKFVVEAAGINALFGILMVTLLWFPLLRGPTVIAEYLFLSPNFHLWTILHYAATFRYADLGNWNLARVE